MKKLLETIGDIGYMWVTDHWTFILGIIAGLALVLVVCLRGQ